MVALSLLYMAFIILQKWFGRNLSADVAAKAADLINWIATPLGTRLAMTGDGGWRTQFAAT